MAEDNKTTDGSTVANTVLVTPESTSTTVSQEATVVKPLTPQAVLESSNTLSPPNALETSNNLATVNRELQEKSILRHARDLNMPYVNLGKTPLNPDFFKLLPLKIVKSGRIVVFFRVGKKVRVAVENKDKPETIAAIDLLKKNGYEVDINLSSSAGIDDAIKIYDDNEKYTQIKIVKKVDQGSIKTYEKEIENMGSLGEKLNNITAEQGVNLINMGAMRTGASDIHYEPEKNIVKVRFRIDGILHHVFKIKKTTYKNIEKQIKYESKMRLNMNTVPQDGRYDFDYNNKKIAVRVSLLPTPFGQSFVCRLLVGGEKTLSFTDLGFQDLALKRLENATKISQGMVLITGPTGSGKTTTLYSMLNAMNTSENKIITLEDPVEYQVGGVTQSQIDEDNGYTFASGLRALLRQDPDIIMLGEIRDLVTGETAAQAALTGHVLLSTLHTNSALETIPRLINMGLPPFMVAPAIDTIVAQRLVRKVCPHCVTMEPITSSERIEFEKIIENLKTVNKGILINVPENIARVHGCSKCSNTGYKGRLVLAEVVTIGSEMKDLILNEESSIKLLIAARKDGMITMREDGHVKVAQGLTSLEEVHRVTNVASHTYRES